MSTSLDNLFDAVYPADKPDYFEATADGPDATLYYQAKDRIDSLNNAIDAAIRYIKTHNVPQDEIVDVLHDARFPKPGWWR